MDKVQKLGTASCRAWQSVCLGWQLCLRAAEGQAEFPLREGTPFKGEMRRKSQTYVLLYPGWSRSWQMAAVIRTKMSIWENFSWIR